jgi:hypothetical protein
MNMIERCVTLFRADDGGVDGAGEKRGDAVNRTGIDHDHVFGAHPVLYEDVSEHERGDRGDARRGDFLAFQILQAGDIGPHHNPLENLIVHCENSLERRIAL